MPSEMTSGFNPILSAKLLCAAHAQDHVALQGLLLRSDVDINIVGADHLNVFMISVVKGDHATVTALTARSDLLINAKTGGGLLGVDAGLGVEPAGDSADHTDAGGPANQ